MTRSSIILPMTRSRRIFIATALGCALAVMLAAVLVLLLAWWMERLEAPPAHPEQAAVPRIEETLRAGLRPPPPSPQLLQRARGLMGEVSEHSCGPYLLLTDVEDPQLVRSCKSLASSLDRVYEERYGLDLDGAWAPEGALVIFARRGAFRELARQEGGPRVGYAGYSSGSQSVVVLTAEGAQQAELLRTLTHELTHLVNRRTLGSGLPRWLSEGLADGVGDSAVAGGWLALEGLAGVEGPARRLYLAYGEAMVPSLERLLSLQRGDFDRGTVSFDYEQSALFVRYLLHDDALAAGFRAYLQRLAAGEEYDAEALRESLGRSWGELDRGLEAWLQRSMESG
ncbi:MAG: hypothetical protein SX243_07745 [Acidobacteriota bacterium]|nr:hypothetical protein [Acidobacteriota bacterium]